VPHAGPDGADARVSAPTMNRWRQDYLAEWFEALVTPPRQVEARTPEEVLTLAALSGRTRSGRPPMSGGSPPGCLDGRRSRDVHRNRVLTALSGWERDRCS
jgi:hypothetical protein